MSRTRPLLPIAAITLALALGACSSGSGESSPTTTVPTTPPSTTTTSTSTTTTTTTLPPGLQPQTLSYGLEAGQMWNHDTELTMVIDYDIVEFELEDLTLRDLGTDTGGSVTTTMSGTQRTLLLETDGAGATEAVFDVRFDEGTVTIKSGPTEITTELTPAELAAPGDALPPLVIDRSGAPMEASAGSPGVYSLQSNVQDVMATLGPIFAEHDVDVGDTWLLDEEIATLGRITGEASVTDEVAYGDDYAFVIDYSSELVDVPVALDADAMAQVGQLAEASSLALLSGLLPAGGDTMLDITSSRIEGTAIFDPVTGIVIQLDIETHMATTLTMADDSGKIAIDYVTDITTSYDFADSGEANSFEVTAVLDQFETDPFLLADLQFTPLFSYLIDEADEEVWLSFLGVLEETYADVTAGLSAIAVSDGSGEWVDVFSLTNGGGVRGYPDLGAELTELWTGKAGRSVDVADSVAYRTTIDGREWLVWSSDTHTIVVVGLRSLALQTLELVVEADDPYLWEAGDCLAFHDYDDIVPYSPFGEYGLRHCTRTHEYEVLYSEVLPEGPSDPFPDDIGDRVRQACGARFYDHTGAYPLESALGMIRYLPDEAEWDRGARYIACVIYLEDQDGLVAVDARLAGAGADNPVTIVQGTCLLGSTSVPCTDPHDAEVTAVREYDAPLDADYPDFETVWEETDDDCGVALEDYDATEGEADLESSAISDMHLGWEHGVRNYYCIGFAVDEDEFLIGIVGRLREAWEIAAAQIDA